MTINSIPYKDIEVVKNTHCYNSTTYWTVEIDTKLTKRQAELLSDMIYNMDL